MLSSTVARLAIFALVILVASPALAAVPLPILATGNSSPRAPRLARFLDEDDARHDARGFLVAR